MAKKKAAAPATKKKAAAPATKKKTVRAAPKKVAVKKPAGGKRLSWLDDKSQPLIDNYARQTESFVKAMADGSIDSHEIERQEKSLVAAMKQVEPELDDALHAKVTRLLCELTVYDIMQVMGSLNETRRAAEFRG
jgi:hypothetical protein